MAGSESSAETDHLAPAEPDEHRTKADHISRSSLSQQIAQRLHDDIVHGRIPAGTHLVQDELCERFGTSRMPVRDALQQLTHEGLLKQHGQQRVVVPLGADELEEVNTLTAVLHGWAARRAAAVATDGELDELEWIYRAELETEDPYEFGQLAMRFHRMINLLAHSPRLIRTLAAFQQTVPRTMPFQVPDVMAKSKAQHGEVLAALRDRDGDQAERLVRSQTMESVALLMQSIAGH